MRIDITKEAGLVVIAVEGEIDLETSPRLRECFDRLLTEGEQNYVVDMAGVDSIDSSGLAAFVMLFKRVRIGQGNVRLCCTKPEIQRIFELTKLNRVFDIFATTAQAVESLR